MYFYYVLLENCSNFLHKLLKIDFSAVKYVTQNSYKRKVWPYFGCQFYINKTRIIIIKSCLKCAIYSKTKMHFFITFFYNLKLQNIIFILNKVLPYIVCELFEFLYQTSSVPKMRK